MTEPWIEELLRIIYSGRIINNRLNEAKNFKNSHLPGRIYKYRCFNENSLRNLREDTVWLASPDRYNDPYDCLFSISDEEVLPILQQALEDQLRRAHPGAGLPSPESAKAMLSGAMTSLKAMRGMTKICSFSAAKDIILMWSHYANHHKGFCVEYDLGPLEPSAPLRWELFPVIYDPALYNLTAYFQGLCAEDRGAFIVNGLLPPVFYKYTGWSYEKEWRLVLVCEQVCPDHAHPVPKPSRVYLGAKVDPAEARQIYEICEARDIMVLKMKMGSQRFELDVETYTPS
jgi:hypothetical protein